MPFYSLIVERHDAHWDVRPKGLPDHAHLPQHESLEAAVRSAVRLAERTSARGGECRVYVRDEDDNLRLEQVVPPRGAGESPG